MKIAFAFSMALSRLALMLCTAPDPVHAQVPTAPAWAQPGSATHVQVAPPPEFWVINLIFQLLKLYLPTGIPRAFYRSGLTRTL
jgi:hypothetical protein